MRFEVLYHSILFQEYGRKSDQRSSKPSTKGCKDRSFRAQLGAAQAVGVDIDPLSITASRHNAERNGLKPETLRVCLADRESADNPLPENIPIESSDEAKGGVGAFDIVVANILLNPLVALANRITGYAKAGAVVGLSGVLEEQVPQVVRTYEEYLEDIQVTTEGGWACVTGRRR